MATWVDTLHARFGCLMGNSISGFLAIYCDTLPVYEPLSCITICSFPLLGGGCLFLSFSALPPCRGRGLILECLEGKSIIIFHQMGGGPFSHLTSLSVSMGVRPVSPLCCRSVTFMSPRGSAVRLKPPGVGGIGESGLSWEHSHI